MSWTNARRTDGITVALYRDRTRNTKVGRIDLCIHKLRQGSYFPSPLEPRRRAERAVVAVVQKAYIHGVSTRKVDDLVQALGMTGISKSEMSRLTHPSATLYLDADSAAG